LSHTSPTKEEKMLQLRLLGQFDVRLDGKRIVIPSRAGQSLLAYLALTAGITHRREKLAGVLWPDTTDENARKNLRQELWRIRKALSSEKVTNKAYILADEFSLMFNREIDYWLDTEQLEKQNFDLQSLLTNLSLYQGELLPGFYEDWVTLERERIQAVFETRMEQLLDQLVELERWIAVQEWGERWLTLSGVREAAYRALMLASGVHGDVARVASLYQRCTKELKENLGVNPSAETRALYEGLLKGAQVSSHSSNIQPAGTITFLFTDMEGSTRLIEKLDAQYPRMLREYQEILRASIQEWNGHEVDTQGDSFFVTFARASDAIQCAMEAQRAIAAHTWPQDEIVRVRMGLHSGEPLVTSAGYIGIDVHRAARIGDAGHGGQILLSQTTYELVKNELPPSASLRDIGEHHLKDLKYPTAIYQLVLDDFPSEFPPLRSKFTGTEPPMPGEPPFKGLQYFDEADADLFFGREAITAKLIHRLSNKQHLTVIIGASGSGKSSIARAGLVPVLKKGEALWDGTKPPEGSTDWHIHVMTPTAHPLEMLATEVTHSLESVTAAATLMDDLTLDPRSLSLFLTRSNHNRTTVLVVDQCEELFTLCRDPFEREAFIDNLLTALATLMGRFILVLTLRADFYSHLAQYPELRDLVANHQEYIGTMSPEDMRRAIEEPAKRGLWEFEQGLVDLILRDIGEEPGALPLLSHALLETWKRRAGHVLTLKGYADAGGIRGAIAYTAENVYRNLPTSEQTIVRNIFLRLTEFGEGTEDTRRRASFDELISPEGDAHKTHAILNKLAEARLITLSENTAEVAHEALIREWPQLREWLSQDRDGILLHRHLTEASREWDLLERDPGSLYRGARLAQANEWLALHPKALNSQERLFLEASNQLAVQEQREKEEQQQRELEAAQKLAATEKARAEEQAHAANRLRIRNRVITVVGSLAIVLAILAGIFGLRSSENAEQAEASFKHAEAQRLALEANRLLLAAGSPEQIALLSLKSMKTQYTPEGDAALAAAAGLDYPVQLFKQSNQVMAVALSPDGRHVLTGGSDGVARLWDLQDGEEILQFMGHTELIYSIAFSPDGKFVLTGSWDKSARVWDATTGEEIRQFIGHSDFLGNVAYSPDGKSVLTSSQDRTTRLWDTANGREQQKFIGYSAAFSHNGKYLLTVNNDGEAHLWDILTNQEVHHFIHGHTSIISSVIFSPDDKYILTASYDTTARLWDAATGKELQRFTGHTSNVNSVAFSSDGKYAFTASGDGTTRIWDLQSGQESRRFTSPAFVNSLALSADNKLVLTGSNDGTARLWSIESRPELPSFHSPPGFGAVAFSPDGKLVLTGDFNGIASLWDAESGKKLRDFIGDTDIINYGAVFSPDGKYVLTGSWDSTVRLSDVQTGEELRQFKGHNSGVNSVAFSPDGKYVIAATNRAGAWLWHTESGQKIRQFTNVASLFRAVFSPDGKYIATASGPGDGAARLLDISTGEVVRQFTGASDSMNSVAFSPDGKYILSGDNDNIARLWDIQTGQEIRQFVGHRDLVYSATFSPDGKYVATASNDSTARLWDTQTGQELRRFTGHTAGVENVAFSPDGKYLLTASDDGTARLWDVDYHNTMEYLCSRLLRDFTDDERAQYGITDDTPTCP
jgi:WD40 repeat protein/class 3 adenylate cyclase